MSEMMERAVEDFITARAAEQRGASGNTLAAYANDLLQLCEYLEQLHHVTQWDAVEAGHLDAFLTFLAQRDYAPTTVARKLAATKAFFRHQVTTAARPVSPAAALRAPRVERTAPRALDAAAIAQLFAAVRADGPAGLRDRAMLYLLYATGLRVSEVVALNVGDLTGMDDLDGRDDSMANVQAQVVCRGRGGRTRTLPLAATARAALAVYLDTARPQLLRGGGPALFVNQRGERLTRQGFWLVVTGYARAAGIVGLTPHTLRHSFARDLISRGVELREVGERLGHANLSTTQMYRPLQSDATARPAADAAVDPPDARDAARDATERDTAGEAVAPALERLDTLDPALNPAVAIALPTDERRARNTVLRPGGL